MLAMGRSNPASSLGQGEHGRRGRLVLEPAGVGDQPGVEAGGRVAGERPAEAAGQLAHDHRGRGRVGVDDVDRPVAGVGAMVVEHDQPAACRGRTGRCPELAEPVERTAVEGDHHVGIGREVRRLGAPGRGPGGTCSAGPRGTVRATRPPTACPGPRHRWWRPSMRAEGVAVGFDVAGEGHGLGAADQLGGLRHHLVARRRLSHRRPLGAWRRAGSRRRRAGSRRRRAGSRRG